ncbi:sugar ABC transporter substrate-binding protein [Isoalcanivorax beigongshangi]|uniref:Sugar ABC transporter substrate-binding protein n=1 Tax=Isoalcanivorax beigongshangi TaxID=3238810 RepID=A0ABV4AD30_9GAMM
MKNNNVLKVMVTSLALVSAAGIAEAEQQSPLAGKTLAFVPTSLGYDLTDGWYNMLRKELGAEGLNITVRDPNWSTATGAQALVSLIAQKPDVLMVQNPDVQSYSRLLKRAEDAGIPVLQINMRSSVQTTAFVGADWVGIGRAMANAAVEYCGEDSGRSGKVSLVQGPLTSASSVFQMEGINAVLKGRKDIQVVSSQAANWDPSQARAITDTVAKQHGDLCAVIDFWDGQAVGSAAAIRRHRGDQKVHLITNGGAEKTAACDNIANGTFDQYMTYSVREQSTAIAEVVRKIITEGIKPGGEQLDRTTAVRVITADNLADDSCWALSDYK